MNFDKKINAKIVGLFALYCSSGRTFSLTEYIFKERGINKNINKCFDKIGNILLDRFYLLSINFQN